MQPPALQMLVDRVDEDDRVIGTIRRDEVFAQRANFRVVHFFVSNEQDELLLQKLGRAHPRHPGHWGSSVAGYVSAGETYDEAAERKLRQELGVSGLDFDFFGKTSMVDEGCKKFIALYTLLHNGPFRPDPASIQRVAFFNRERLSSLMVSPREEVTPTFRHLFGFYRAATRA